MAEANGAKAGEAEPSVPGLNEAFAISYQYMSYVGIAVILALFFISVFDLALFYKRQWSQKIQLQRHPRMFNKDTNEYDILSYTNTNVADEPYTIFAEQHLLSFSYLLVIGVIVVFVLQLTAFVCLRLWANFRGGKFNEHVSIDFKVSLILFLTFVNAVVMTLIYRTQFTRTMQPKLAMYQQHINEMQTFVYSRLSQKSAFLDALRSNDIGRVVELLRNEPTLGGLQKMLFTINLFNFYKTTVPETDDAFTELMPIFTPQGIRTRAVTIVDYMYFDQKRFMKDAMPLLKKDLQSAYSAAQLKTVEQNMRRDVFAFNKMILRLRRMNGGPTMMESLVWMRVTAAFAFVAVLGMMFAPQIRSLWRMVGPTIASAWSRVVDRIRGFL